MVVQAGGSEGGLALGATHADVVFTVAQTKAKAVAFRDDIRSRAVAAGLGPDHVKISLGVIVLVGTDEADAAARAEELYRTLDIDSLARGVLAGLGLPDADPDDPIRIQDLPDIGSGSAFSTEFQVSTRALIAEEPVSARDIVRRSAGGPAGGHRLVIGSPAQIADDIQAWFESGAADGFTVMYADTSVDFERFARLVVPILIERGLFTPADVGSTLRDRLDFPTPTSGAGRCRPSRPEPAVHQRRIRQAPVPAERRHSMGSTSTISRTAAEAVSAADDHPIVRRVRRYAQTVLRPTALPTDRAGVTEERIAQLRELGLLNHLAPAAYGGLDVDRNTDRRLHEIVSGACFNTWLVWAQHGPLAGRIAGRPPDAPLPELFERVLRGEVLLGAGISDVRRFPDRYIAATRVDGGWEFAGTVSWVSGWGLNCALTVAAVEPETATVVTALVEVGDRTRATPLHLSAVSGSRTERVLLDHVFVRDTHVLGTQPIERWRFDDIGTAGDARAHHFGLAETVLGELEASDQPPARAVATTWRPRIDEIRSRAYALADEAFVAGGGPHRLQERLATKVASGEALSVITRALVVARSERGLAGDDTAQLHARSALFVLVQGQTADVRAAQLARLAR